MNWNLIRKMTWTATWRCWWTNCVPPRKNIGRRLLVWNKSWILPSFRYFRIVLFYFFVCCVSNGITVFFSGGKLQNIFWRFWRAVQNLIFYSWENRKCYFGFDLSRCSLVRVKCHVVHTASFQPSGRCIDVKTTFYLHWFLYSFWNKFQKQRDNFHEHICSFCSKIKFLGWKEQALV